MKYEYWLQQLYKEGVGPKKRRMLRETFGCARAVYEQPEQALRRLPGQGKGITEKLVEKIIENRKAWDLEQYALLAEKQIGFVTEEDPAFPARLKALPDRPDALFYKGKLPDADAPSVAVVGARECSSYGREMALYFSGELAGQGVQIISGLAWGIDGYAHQGALDKGGVTFGVLGNGVDICYPRGHIQLYMDIQRKGGLLSEYPPGTPSLKQHFPMRNRIISGLADLVLVVEAKEKSGSLITADQALEQGRDVYAVPGRVWDANSRGCNRLIGQGAGIAFSVEELKKELGLFCPKSEKILNREKISLATEEKLVYSCLDLQPKGLDEIVEASGLTVSQTLSMLLSLQLKGYIAETERAHYSITGSPLP